MGRKTELAQLALTEARTAIEDEERFLIANVKAMGELLQWYSYDEIKQMISGGGLFFTSKNGDVVSKGIAATRSPSF